MENIVIQLEDQSLINWNLLDVDQIQSILEREFQLDPIRMLNISELLKYRKKKSHLSELYSINWIYPLFRINSIKLNDTTKIVEPITTEKLINYKSKIQKLNFQNNTVILPSMVSLTGFEINANAKGSNIVKFNSGRLIYNSSEDSSGNIEYINNRFPKFKKNISSSDIEYLYGLYQILYHSIVDEYNYKSKERKIIKEYEVYNNLMLIKQVNNQKWNFDKSLESIYGPWNYIENTLCDNYIGFIEYLGNFKINYYSDRLEELKNYFTLQKKIFEKLSNEKIIKIKNNIYRNYYNYAVYTSLGPTIFIKYKAGVSLTTNQKEIVEKFLSVQAEQQKRYITNTCGHIPIRDAFNSEQNVKTKRELMQKLMREFGKNGVDPETKFIFCSTCGFNIGCEHETIEDPDQLDKYEILNGVLIECKYCQRVIATDTLLYSPEYDENNQLITGNVVDTDDNLMYLQGIINNILRYTKTMGRIRMSTILDYIYNILLIKYDEIKNKEFIQVQNDLIKKIITICYIYGFLVNQDNYEIKMFKGLETKEKRKLFYNLLSENDPRFIKELDQTNNVKLFVNTMSKAEKYFENNIVRSVNRIANKLYGYKFQFKQIPDDLTRKQLIADYLKNKKSMFCGIPFKRLDIKHYTLFKIRNSILERLEDYSGFDEEIRNLLGIICFGRTDTIEFHGVKVDCKAIDKKVINKIRDDISKPAKPQKIKELSKVYKQKEVYPQNKLEDKDVKTFGSKYLDIENFYNTINRVIYNEQSNIIHRFIRYYRQIQNGMISSEYDNKFIENYQSRYFTPKIEFIFNKPISYYFNKVNVNEQVTDFILKFIEKINESIDVAEYTDESLEQIETKIKDEIRKNYELYGKLTPDEKLNYQFSKNFADKFAQVAEIRKQKEEELENEFDKPMKEDVPFEQSYDDIRSHDDDDIYMHDNGEVEYFNQHNDEDISF